MTRGFECGEICIGDPSCAALPGEIDLVSGGDDSPTSRPKVVDETAFPHVLGNDVVGVTKNDADEPHEVCMPQRTTQQTATDAALKWPSRSDKKPNSVRQSKS